MFSFSFNETDSRGDETVDQESSKPETLLNRKPLLEIVCPVKVNYSYVVYNVCEIELKKVSLEASALDEKGFDIIPGEYEGGRKVWECSVDLARYFMEESVEICTLLGRISVLELGCGHALPGVAVLKTHHSNIDRAIFSDLNEEVLVQTTWPNIILNCEEAVSKVDIKCFAGDWFELSNSIGAFNLILSAETLYTEDCCRMIYNMIDKHLESGGIALIASKKYYFGVGGGTYDLGRFIHSPSSTLTCRTVRVYEDGQSNVREILRIERRKSLSPDEDKSV